MKRKPYFKNALALAVLTASASWGTESENAFFRMLARGFEANLENQKNGSITIFVKTIYGEMITLKVKSIDTVETVKDKIKNEKKIPINVQHLYWADQELLNSRSLSSCGIQKGATLYMLLRLQQD